MDITGAPLSSCKPEVVVVDDFLASPDDVRVLALRQDYVKRGSAGKRSTAAFRHLVNPAVFENLLGRQITRWDEYDVNGCFQFCTAEDPVVYHSDDQSHAGIIFLTPQAPIEAGLTLVRSRGTWARHPGEDPDPEATYRGNLLDPTKWDAVDKIGNVYNRLVLFNGRLNHAPSCYFGTSLENSRLFQMFFFDAV